MEMEWERHTSLFASDGSLRDLYVRGTDVSDWQRLLDFLRAGAYTLRYIVDAEQEPQPCSTRSCRRIPCSRERRRA
jgi:hypothetical protein